jgi:hypothetical protein
MQEMLLDLGLIVSEDSKAHCCVPFCGHCPSAGFGLRETSYEEKMHKDGIVEDH